MVAVKAAAAPPPPHTCHLLALGELLTLGIWDIDSYPTNVFS